MANQEIYYTLTPSAPSVAKGVLCVVVGYKGQSTGRKPFPINGSADFHGGQMGMSEYSIIFAK